MSCVWDSSVWHPFWSYETMRACAVDFMHTTQDNPRPIGRVQKSRGFNPRIFMHTTMHYG